MATVNPLTGTLKPQSNGSFIQPYIRWLVDWPLM